MTTINMHMKFEIKIPKQTLRSGNHAAYRVQKPKKKYGRQAAILKMT